MPKQTRLLKYELWDVDNSSIEKFARSNADLIAVVAIHFDNGAHLQPIKIQIHDGSGYLVFDAFAEFKGQLINRRASEAWWHSQPSSIAHYIHGLVVVFDQNFPRIDSMISSMK